MTTYTVGDVLFGGDLVVIEADQDHVTVCTPKYTLNPGAGPITATFQPGVPLALLQVWLNAIIEMYGPKTFAVTATTKKRKR